MSAEARLRELGIELPPPFKPVGSYVAAKVSRGVRMMISLTVKGGGGSPVMTSGPPHAASRVSAIAAVVRDMRA